MTHGRPLETVGPSARVPMERLVTAGLVVDWYVPYAALPVISILDATANFFLSSKWTAE